MSAVSLNKLQKETSDLLNQVSTGFPLPLLRAHLIRQNSPDGLLPAEALKDKYRLTDRTISGQLVSQLIQSESSAFLTNHIMALEAAIQNTDKLPTLGKNPSKVLQLALEDAQDVVSHRLSQPVSMRDKNLVDDQLYHLIWSSPKVLLHEHYRGCSPYAMVRARLLEKKQYRAAFKSNADLQEYCRTDRLFGPNGEGPLYHRSLNRYRLKNDFIVSAAIHSDETAYLAAYLYTLKLAMENVRYFEYRLNPISRNVKDPLQYARHIQQGIDDARAFLWRSQGQNIDCNLIFSADRQPKPGVEVDKISAPIPPPHILGDMQDGGVTAVFQAIANIMQNTQADSRIKLAVRVLESAIIGRLSGVKVTGFDVQGDESGYAITDFKPVAEILHLWNQLAWTKFQTGEWKEDLRIGATIHAGETPYSGFISHPKAPLTGTESIAKSIELFWDKNTPVRIGHGLRIMYDPKLLKVVQEKNIGLEQCPKSNVQTGAVSYYYDSPSLALSRDYGVKVSVSCDNSTTSKTDSCNELVKLSKHWFATQNDRKQFQLNGIDTAFIFDAAQKQQIRSDMLKTYETLEQRPEAKQVLQKEQSRESYLKLLGSWAV